ncbi:MAG TPA: glutathione peroxidase [Marmoricola sp.]|nr:glutathione peroxidase [Marmoricola sp.]HNI70766.1 glutathione peroxidase [Marmoricola sp.]HNN47894.1 glutathione peroxidase [Marmoricola sp.]
MTVITDFTATRIDGSEQSLADYAGQVTLVVNTASKCGFTPQFAGLEKLQQTYADQGFAVLGFPCNQFANQDPGSNEEINEFCTRKYDVTFPMFARIEVNGSSAHPLYKWLRAEKSGRLGSAIKWNFTKFLVGRDGRVLKRYGSSTKPSEIAGDIEAALGD